MKSNPLVYEQNRCCKGIIRKLLGIFMSLLILINLYELPKTMLNGEISKSKIIGELILLLILASILYCILRKNNHPSIRHLGKILSYKQIKEHLGTQNFKTVYQSDKIILMESDLWILLRNSRSSYFIPKRMIIGTYIEIIRSQYKDSFALVFPLINGNEVSFYIGINYSKAQSIEKFVMNLIPNPHAMMKVENCATGGEENCLRYWWDNNRKIVKSEYNKTLNDGVSFMKNYISL